VHLDATLYVMGMSLLLLLLLLLSGLLGGEA
jgi:hypothetical protein